MRFALHYLRLSRQKHMILEKMMKWAFYYLSLGKEIIFVLIWVAVQKYLFFDTLQSFHSSPQFASTNELTGYGVALAKACAAVINFNSALLVVSMCQISITALQASPLGRIIPFEKYRVAHRMASCSIVTYSLVHTAAHYYNYAQIPTNWLALAFKTGPGLTGHGLWLCLLTIGGTSLFKCVRKSSFEVFWYTHYLSLVFLLLLNFHGAFCFIKRDFNPQCPGARSWRWLVGPCTLFMVELAIREWRSHRFTFISKVVVHQANVIEIQLKKPSFVFKPGQYVQLNCPEISFVQWHPFTVTSAPEEGFISVHVKMVGCWTKKLGALLGVQFKEGVNGYTAPAQFPQIFIDGPYGSVSESFDRFDVAICIGAGIGQTPFASILKSMWYSITHPTQQAKLKRIVYYGLSREVQSLSWFLDLLRALEEQETNSSVLELNIYMTGILNPSQALFLHLDNGIKRPDPLTGLKAKTHYGRPDFKAIFSELKTNHQNSGRIGVFYCGPAKLGRFIKSQCIRISSTEQIFEFYQETF